MGKDVYTIGIVGFGGMGSYHLELAKGIDEVKFVGSYDIKESRQQLAKEKGLRVYDSLEDILADDTIDIILIATPNDVHKDIAIKAMEAGKAVVCEKPVTMNSADLQEMMDVSENRQALVVHQNRRWDEDFLTMKKIYEEKMLGEVFAIESRYMVPGEFPETGGEKRSMAAGWYWIGEFTFWIRPC